MAKAYNPTDDFEDDAGTSDTTASNKVRVTLVVDFDVYREGERFAPTLKPEGKEATYAFANLTAEHATIIAAALGLPTDKPWKAGGVRFGIPARHMKPEARAAAIVRGKAKLAKQAEAAQKRKTSAGVK